MTQMLVKDTDDHQQGKPLLDADAEGQKGTYDDCVSTYTSSHFAFVTETMPFLDHNRNGFAIPHFEGRRESEIQEKAGIAQNGCISVDHHTPTIRTHAPSIDHHKYSSSGDKEFTFKPTRSHGL